MKRLAAVFVLLAASPVIAEEAKAPPQPTKPAISGAVLTADEGRRLAEAAFRAGAAKQALDTAQAEMKPILDKLAPPKP